MCALSTALDSCETYPAPSHLLDLTASAAAVASATDNGVGVAGNQVGRWAGGQVGRLGFLGWPAC